MRCSVFRQTVVFLALNLLRQTGDNDFRLEHVRHRQCTAGDLCIDLFWISVMITSHLTIQVKERQGIAMYLGGTGPNSMHTKLVCNEAVHTAQPNLRILTQMETRTLCDDPAMGCSGCISYINASGQFWELISNSGEMLFVPKVQY